MNRSISPKHYLWLANLLVLALVVWSAVSLGMSILGEHLEDGAGGGGAVESGPAVRQRLKPLSSYQAIAESGIFGGEEPEEPAAAAEPTDEPPAEAAGIDFRLRGTMVDRRTGYEAAIIEQPGQDQALYRPGAEIGGVELVSVEIDHVILSRGGEEIKLGIYSEQPDALPFDGRKAAAARRARAARAESKKSESGEEPIARAVGPNEYVVSRETLSKHIGDLNYFMSNVRIQPYFKDGQAHGFKVAHVRRNSPVYELGVRRGDIILSVNDVSVGRPEDLVNLYRQLSQLNEVAVGVERKGEEITLNYSLR